MKVARIENFPYILPYNHPPYPTPCPYLKHNIYIYVPVYLPSRKTSLKSLRLRKLLD